MRGRPGKLFSDSLFCNCPNGLLSSVERRESLERDVQSFTRGLTHTDAQRGSLRWKCEGGDHTGSWSAFVRERMFRGSMDVSPE